MADLAIICPTLNRADKLPALVEDIAANTLTSHRIYLVMEIGDRETETVARGLDTVDVIGDFGSCAAAYNAGFVASEEPYCFLANDDLEFPEGWELPALSMIEDYPIVGVNEGHDRLTCFAMVRRSYIEEHSGVYDRPGTLCHPYESQYVDTELAEYARHRGVWAEAWEGGVVHRHHEFGEADPSHPNYVKARSTVRDDHATYERRKAAWTQT